VELKNKERPDADMGIIQEVPSEARRHKAQASEASRPITGGENDSGRDAIQGESTLKPSQGGQGEGTHAGSPTSSGSEGSGSESEDEHEHGEHHHKTGDRTEKIIQKI